MDERTLGTSGIDVHSLGYGAMELRGPPRGRDLTEKQVGELLNFALDSGVDMIDTSIDYEMSEERIGRHISHRRDEFVLATKCGCLVGWERPADYKGGLRGGGPHDFSRENIVAGVEQSLRRLRTDHLDLVQVHASPDVATLEEFGVVETLEGLRAEGKTRLIGMSGVLPDVEDHVAMGVFDVIQMPFSPVQLSHEGAIAKAAGAGAGVLVRGGAGRGVSSGGTESREKNPKLAEAWDTAALGSLLDGMSPMEFTIRFTLGTPGVSSAIVGTANVDHMKSNLEAAAKGPLPDELHDAARRRLLEAQHDG